MIENIVEGFSGELGSSVENEFVWEAIVCENSANKSFHGLFCGGRFVARFSKITPFVRPWSTTTMMESYPSEHGRLVTKSMDNWVNGRADSGAVMGSRLGFDRLDNSSRRKLSDVGLGDLTRSALLMVFSVLLDIFHLLG